MPRQGRPKRARVGGGVNVDVPTTGRVARDFNILRGPPSPGANGPADAPALPRREPEPVPAAEPAPGARPAEGEPPEPGRAAHVAAAPEAAEGGTASPSELARAMDVQLLSVGAMILSFVMVWVFIPIYIWSRMQEEFPVSVQLALCVCLLLDSVSNDFCAHWLACTVEDWQLDEARAVAVARRERLILAKLLVGGIGVTVRRARTGNPDCSSCSAFPLEFVGCITLRGGMGDNK